MKLVINGQIQSDLTKLPYSDALIRGDGLFETMLAIDDKPVALDRHLARIEKSAAISLLTLPALIDIQLAITAVLENQIGKSKLRLVVLSDGNWFISCQPLSEESASTSLTRFDTPVFSKDYLNTVKSTSYARSLLAVRYAKSLGFDDCLFINEAGIVVETGFSNLLVLNNSKWVTPALTTGCLPGITRELLIKWFDVSEIEISFDELLTSQAVYVTSSLRLIQRVNRIESRSFSENSLGKELISQFNQRLFSNINP
jgi:branched-subunit amino acid aminotransferase/4-amino-4-deoxychorismate lyase